MAPGGREDVDLDQSQATHNCGAAIPGCLSQINTPPGSMKQICRHAEYFSFNEASNRDLSVVQDAHDAGARDAALGRNGRTAHV